MAKRKLVAAGNWKMFKTPAQTRDFFGKFLPALGAVPDDREMVVAPTALCLTTAVDCAKGTRVKISAQNCMNKNSGAFTGEISPEQIKAAGAHHVILGHSERRAIFKETDQDIRAKVALALETGLVPIFCVGETLAEREAGQLKSVLERQVTYGLEGIDLAGPDVMMVAYEPVWAIGTGKTAGPDDAEEAQSFIRGLVVRLYGEALAQGIRILYGGSVKPDNTHDLTSKPNVDGVLVGGASLEPDSFLGITKNMAGGK